MPRIAGVLTQLCGAGCVLVGIVAFALLIDQMDGAYLAILLSWVGAGLMALVLGGLAGRPSPASLMISAALDASFCGVLFAVASRLPVWLRMLEADDASNAAAVVISISVTSGLAMLVSLVATPLALRYWRASAAAAAAASSPRLAAGSLIGPAALLAHPGAELGPESTAPGFPPPVTGAFTLGPADSGEIVLPAGGVAAAKAARKDKPSQPAPMKQARTEVASLPQQPMPPMSAAPMPPMSANVSPYAPQGSAASPYAPHGAGQPLAQPGYQGPQGHQGPYGQPFANGPLPGQPGAPAHGAASHEPGPGSFNVGPKLAPQPPLRRDHTPNPLMPPQFGQPAAYQDEPRHPHAAPMGPMGAMGAMGAMGPMGPMDATGPQLGQPFTGGPLPGQPFAGGPLPGQPAFAQPAYGQPTAYGQPAPAALPSFVRTVVQAPAPTYGQPAYGQPAYGQPTGQPFAGGPLPGQPGSGQPAFAQSALRHDATPPLTRAPADGYEPSASDGPRKGRGLWLLAAGLLVGAIAAIAAVVVSSGEGGSGQTAAVQLDSAKGDGKGLTGAGTPPQQGAAADSATAAGSSGDQPARTVARPPASPAELVDAIAAAAARADTAALEALAIPTAFGFGVRATSISRTREALAAAFAADLGAVPADGFVVTPSGLEIGQEGTHAWIATELDVVDGDERRRFAVTLLATAVDDAWKIAAWHWAVRLPDETIEAMAEAGDLPIPEGFDDRIDAPAEAAEAFRAAFSSTDNYGLAISPRVTSFNFGSAPGERIKGGDAIRRVFRKLRADIRIREGVIVTGAGSWDPSQAAAPAVAWAAANVEFTTKKSRRILRVLSILVRENDEWRLVQTQWSDGA